MYTSLCATHARLTANKRQLSLSTQSLKAKKTSKYVQCNSHAYIAIFKSSQEFCVGNYSMVMVEAICIRRVYMNANAWAGVSSLTAAFFEKWAANLNHSSKSSRSVQAASTFDKSQEYNFIVLFLMTIKTVQGIKFLSSSLSWDKAALWEYLPESASLFEDEVNWPLLLAEKVQLSLPSLSSRRLHWNVWRW